MTINEFTAKKIGEAIAFTKVGTDTITQGHSALVQILGQEKVQDMLDKNRLYGDEIIRIATDYGAIDMALSESKKMEEKLEQMREIYTQANWASPAELLGWSGFFEGAVITHFAVVRGAGEELNDESMITLANEAISYHYELLDQTESELATLGQDKSSM